MHSLLRGVSVRGLAPVFVVSLSACQLLEDVVAENPGASGSGGMAIGGGGAGGVPSAGSSGAGGLGASGAGGTGAGLGGQMAGAAGLVTTAGVGGIGGDSAGIGGAGVAGSGIGGAGSGGGGFAGGGTSGGSLVSGGVGGLGGLGGGAGTGATGGTAGVGGAAGGSGGSAGMPSVPFVPCQIANPAFCERTDAAAPGGRAGDLDETRWNASRLALLVNPSGGPYVAWVPTQASGCAQSPVTLQADGDLLLCASGRLGLHDALHVDSNYHREINRALMVRQPFDFAGRVGRIAFELASAGPVEVVEIWITRDPLTGIAQTMPFPTTAIRFRLSSFGCTGNSARFTVTTGAVQAGADPQAQTPGCFDTGTDEFIHYEIRISTQSIQILATRGSAQPVIVGSFAGTPSLSRGYVHLVHSRVSGDSGVPSTVQEIRWGSVAFDGPVLSAGRNYEVTDSLAPANLEGLPAGSVNIGYGVTFDGGMNLAVDGVDLSGAPLATLLFNAYGASSDAPLQVRANSYTYRTVSTPPTGQFRAIAMSIPVSELVAGRNTFQFLPTGNSRAIVANVSLHLEQASGGTTGRN